MQFAILRKPASRMAFLIILLGILAVSDILFGSVIVPMSSFLKIFSHSDFDSYSLIIREFRIPKMFTALTVGAALSVAGLLMQTLFRNPLADAYILGISSGASLGVAMFVLSGISFLGFGGVAMPAALGALAILILLLLVTARINHISTVLILGVLISSAISALITVLQYFSPSADLQRFVIWTMGNLNTLGLEELKILIPTVLIVVLGTLFMTRQLDISQVSDTFAKTLGVNMFRLKILIISTVALLAGISTAYAGPVGFIGMIMPHLARNFFRSSKHAILIPATALIGANFLIFADILTQIPQIPLPVNAVTALLGIPILVYIIFKSKL